MDRRFLPTAMAVARRQIGGALTNPAQMVPPLLLPLMFFAAFAGGLSKLGETPDFPYPDYTAFIWVFAFFMAASFVAVFTGFTMAADFESGFARRLMLASPARMSVVVGFVIGSLVQTAVSCVIVFVIGVIAGMDIGGGPLDLLIIFGLALLWNAAVMLYVSGVGLRVQKVQTGSLVMIMPVFAILFVAPVYLPREQLTGWLAVAADFNPLTYLFEASRGLLAGEPEKLGVACASVAALSALFYIWARLGLRKFEGAS
jgi:ABC-2 type transport system permease protein